MTLSQAVQRNAERTTYSPVYSSRIFSAHNGKLRRKLTTSFDRLIDSKTLAELDAHYNSVHNEKVTIYSNINLQTPYNRLMLLYLESFFHPDLAFFDGLTSETIRTLDDSIELFRDFNIFHTNFFAFRNGALVGYLMSGFRDNVHYISSIIVHPEHRGCIGPMLFHALKSNISSDLPLTLSTWFLSGRNNKDIELLGDSAKLYKSPVAFWARMGFRPLHKSEMPLFEVMRPYYEEMGRTINPEFANGYLRKLKHFFRNGWDGIYMINDGLK